MADENTKREAVRDTVRMIRYLRVSASPCLPVSPSPVPCLPVSVSPRLRVSVSPRLRVFLLLTVHCLLFTVSCRQDMQDQPRMKPFRATAFFRDGMSSRPPVPGNGSARLSQSRHGILHWQEEHCWNISTGSAAQLRLHRAQTQLQGIAAYPDDVEEFPLPITPDVVKRGKERYDIFCSACHGLTGNGDGMIVRRGFRRAASFHSDNLRQAPVGHYFDAITNGWGAMPSYAAQIPARDRWAIVAYIRALQLSQQNTQPQTGQPQPPASPTATPSSGGHN